MESVMAAAREKFLQSKSDAYKVFAIDRNNIVVSREFETLQEARECAHKYWMKRFLYVECTCINRNNKNLLDFHFHMVRNW